jgi:hypothetical protein
VQRLLRAGCTPEASTYTGETALHVAAESKYDAKHCIEILIRVGVDPTLTSLSLDTPLHVICRNTLLKESSTYFSILENENSLFLSQQIFLLKS